MNIKGLKEFQKKLEQLEENAKSLDGQHNIAIAELLTPEFVCHHTQFSSVDELFENSGFQIENSDDFAAIPDKEWDTYIRSVSSFSDWHTMLSKASEEWAKKKLGL
ncbi:MAG: hypothetical protein AB7U85_00475 [Alphaproteobacteria bacterium]